MLSEDRQDQASLYVLHMLPPAEALAFARELERDPELQQVVADLEASASAIALSAPIQRPPAALRARILAAARTEAGPANTSSRPLVDWIPWTIAAALALTAGTFWYENRTVRESLAFTQRALIELRARDTLATTQIATLNSQVAAYEKALAVVVFDQQKQQGVVRLSRFPKPEQGKDYQLWVMDPKGGKPVSAGLLQVPENGVSRVSFTPERRLPTADTFAISVEPAGGSPEPRGQVILVGQ